jgi:hypothetical protein
MSWNCDEVLMPPDDPWFKGERQEYCCKAPVDCTQDLERCERLLKISQGNGNYGDLASHRWPFGVQVLGKAYVGCVEPAQTFYEE